MRTEKIHKFEKKFTNLIKVHNLEKNSEITTLRKSSWIWKRKKIQKNLKSSQCFWKVDTIDKTRKGKGNKNVKTK